MRRYPLHAHARFVEKRVLSVLTTAGAALLCTAALAQNYPLRHRSPFNDPYHHQELS